MNVFPIVGVMLLVASPFRLTAAEPQKVPVAELGSKFNLVGKLRAPFGSSITVQGVVVEGHDKGYEGGPNLRAQRIDGQATQDGVRIQIKPYFADWGATPHDNLALPKLEPGRTYEMEGYETGGYVGIPTEAYERAGVMLQTTGHYFRTYFMVYRAKPIAAVRFSPREFLGKQALIEGTARTIQGQSIMTGDDWAVVVDSNTGWPSHVEGKLIETFGAYQAAEANPNYFHLIGGRWELVRLEDQIGRKVELRGRALGPNGHWFFDYRGTAIYVESMAELPGWNENNYGRPIAICGVLETAMLPRIDQLWLKAKPDLAQQYIVRNASWSALPGLLGPEDGEDGGRD